MPTCLELPRLVQEMLDRRWRPEAVQKVLGLNFLRALRHLRG
jgi:microsomal dipeptidase-like Zn-dependent dipeptidase